MRLTIVNEKGEKVREIEAPLGRDFVSVDSVAQVLRVLQINGRRYPAKAKTRGEVAGGGKRPWRQKGTGRARQGSIRSPLWRGGGVSHGPRGEGRTLKFNRRVGRTVLSSLLMEKISAGKVILLTNSLHFAKANLFSKFLISLGIGQVRNLFLATNAPEIREIRNVKMVKFVLLSNFNVLDLLSSDWVIMTEDNFMTLRERFGL